MSIAGAAAISIGVWLNGSRRYLPPVQMPAFTNLDEESGMSESVRSIHVQAFAEPNLQHSLSLLRASDSARAPVRILFYGQSITEQGWWMQVADYLRNQYPHAALEIENRAIGAHPSDMLVKTSEADLYPFQPDLVIFHVYGSHKKYEDIIRNIAQQTTADILMANDHIVRDAEVGEDTDANRLWLRTWIYRTKLFGTKTERDENWEAWMDYGFLPSTAAKYHAQLADVRDVWKDYLVVHGLKAAQLLKDQVHLNQRGQDLMAAIIDSYLRPGALVSDIPSDDRVVDQPLIIEGKGEGTVKVPFKGTRVDLLTKPGSQFDTSVLVDGEPPCKLPAAYRFSRSSAYPGSNWPALLRVQHGATPLIAEQWTVTISNANADLNDFSFRVKGSLTGEDGLGDSHSHFSSNSGRISLDPDDWNLAYAKLVIKTAIPEHFQITFSAQCMGTNTLHVALDSTTAPLRVVQGLSNGSHVLELPATAASRVEALRVYRPLFGRQF